MNYEATLRQKYESVFNRFDENKDGKISALELHQCICSIGGELSLTEAEVAVGMLDLDRDGLLGFEDFVGFIEGGAEEEKVKVLRDAFEMYEMDGSGCITARSLKRMLSLLGESTTIDKCKGMIARFDLDGDGVLNFDEFKVMMML